MDNNHTNNKSIMISIPNDFAPSYAKPLHMNNKKELEDDDVTVITTVSSCDSKEPHRNDESSIPDPSTAMELVLERYEVNQSILLIIRSSRVRLFWISRMSDFSDPEIIQALEDAVDRGVDVRLFHNEIPYFDKQKQRIIYDVLGSSRRLTIIPMHARLLPPVITDWLDGFLLRTNLKHCRYLCNEYECLFGGINYNRNRMPTSSSVSNWASMLFGTREEFTNI